MKRIIACLTFLVVLVSALCISTSAVVPADTWKNLRFYLMTQIQNGYNFADSDTGEMLGHGKYCMRGSAFSPDGKYTFGGFLNPKGTAAVEMFDATTGKVAGTYVHLEADGSSVSYPKGISCDDRGYLYVALASLTNKSFASLAVVKYDEKGSNGFLKEVYRNVFIETSDSTKTGVNGCEVQAVNGVYYLYIVVNYDVDYLYRFDVTNPELPVLDNSFGKDGRINLQESPYNLTEGNYLDVDIDGKIYLGFASSDDAGLIVISADGKTVEAKVSQKKGYAVALWDDYVFVSTQSGTPEICIYEKATLTPVDTITFSEANVDNTCDEFVFINVNSVVGIRVINDVLWIADQGNGSAGFDQFLLAPLSDMGKQPVDALVANLKSRLSETAAPETTKSPETTKAPETKAPDTEAPKTEAPAQTNAPEVTASETKSVDEKGGCGSVTSAVACAIVAAFGTAIVFKKRK